MSDTIIKITDRKGDSGRFVGRAATAPVPASLVTFLTGKSYVGASNYSTVTPGVLAAPKVVVVTAVDANDVDYKAVISYKDMSVESMPVTRKIIIPAPIKNAVDGICTVLEGETEAIPAIPPVGGVGDGGNTIVSDWETALGVTAGTFQYLSGGFIKVRR